MRDVPVAMASLALQVWWHKGFASAVDVVRYSPDGRRLAAAGHDKVVEVYGITAAGLRRCGAALGSAYGTVLSLHAHTGWDWGSVKRCHPAGCGWHALLHRTDTGASLQVWWHQL
jgi:hypothetical protein